MKNSHNIFQLKIVTNYKSSRKSLAIVRKKRSIVKSNKVVEKLGSISSPVNSINIFRLLFWLSKNIEISPNAFRFLQKCNII